MKKRFFSIGLVALLNPLLSQAGGADALNLDSEGYIRHWVMLAPIALPEGESGADAIFKEQIKDEAALRPKAGDKAKIGGKELTWHAFSEPRPLMLDADKGKVTLKKGVNVVVFKVINEQNSWQGAMRLLDKAGAPLKDLKIKLSP